MLTGVDKLRKASSDQSPDAYVLVGREFLDGNLDAIEAELRDKYMEAPLDLNGKKITCGSKVTVYPHEGEPTKVKAVRLSGFGWWVVLQDGGEVPAYRVAVRAPLTAEDVLEQALNEAASLDRKEGYWPSAADITNIVNRVASMLQLREDGQ